MVICTMNRAKYIAKFIDSLLLQAYKIKQLIIVDASSGNETENVLQTFPKLHELVDQILYFRVTNSLIGTTKQRNFGLRWVTSDLVAFFDDDMILSHDCLSLMEKAFRVSETKIAGVSPNIEDSGQQQSMLMWRLRLLLFILPSSEPGRYFRSGMASPWIYRGAGKNPIEVDLLASGAVMLQTLMARRVCFNEFFTGYACKEDVEFSLQMKKYGKLFRLPNVNVIHARAPGERRKNMIEYSYVEIKNLYYIQHTCLDNYTIKDSLLFYYSYGMDTLLRMTYVFWPSRKMLSRIQFLIGRFIFFGELLYGHIIKTLGF